MGGVRGICAVHCLIPYFAIEKELKGGIGRSQECKVWEAGVLDLLPPLPPPPHYMFLLATKLSFQPLTKLEWDCLDRIGLQIGLDWTDDSP